MLVANRLMKTADKLISEAAKLLDRGGETAVTLRAVAQAVGVSHNAPYRHFKDRNALLAAVAERDFRALADRFGAIRVLDRVPLERVREALDAVITLGQEYPARYRLLFSDPDIGAAGGTLEEAAMLAFTAFASLVDDLQKTGTLPARPAASIAGLLYATVHGLISLEASGRMREQKGLSGVNQAMSLLLSLISLDQSI